MILRFLLFLSCFTSVVSAVSSIITKEYVCKHLRHLFPRLVSYNRFVEIEKEVLFPPTIFIKKILPGSCIGISFVDSTSLRVCRNQRILIHKTFEGLVERGKCSMGWFFGFKLHLIINEKGWGNSQFHVHAWKRGCG